MVIASAEATAATFTSLLTRVRRAVGDNDANSANQRWTDEEITDAIYLEIYKMHAESSLGNSAPNITSATVTYTAEAYAVDLPSGPDVNAILFVEDYTDSNNPIRLKYESILEGDDYLQYYHYSTSSSRTWARVGRQIAVRPKSSAALTLRIWYIRSPYTGTTTLQQPFPVAHEELISLGAAIRLQEVDDEVPRMRVERYADLWRRFERSKSKNRGPLFVRKNRRFR